MKTKEERLQIVNKIIEEIASRGRRFFYSSTTERISKFVLEGNKKKRLYFIDKYTGKKINPYPRNYAKDRNFSEGGTLWALMHDFREFIITGNYSNGKHGYGGLYCPNWGYPEEDMQAIRQLAMGLGYLNKACVA
ncbi:hypothetical protein [Thermaerobacillus caldiproteolyticus]|uniref:hypothetical protein n=1 Tax=Thermaerobacillus caldiproteolyticus TaxID=247480 RepID=UPI0018F1527C|nr:hypothetical protein [Anoxybacillus caldiproteolyticus]